MHLGCPLLSSSPSTARQVSIRRKTGRPYSRGRIHPGRGNETMDGNPLTGKLKCTIYNFHEGENASLDDDNMVKPIRDAMNKLIYVDDSQISSTEILHINIIRRLRYRRASAACWRRTVRATSFCT